MKGFFVVGLFLISHIICGQEKKYISQETSEYIDTYYKTAIQEMYKYHIPASITLAQGILESGSGNSDLATVANNHFGIKCTSDYKGKTFLKDDDKKDDCFRVYEHAQESYRDHSIFLTSRSRYFFLFNYKLTDYHAWAIGLKRAGYATNPDYPQLLIDVIEQNELYEYDLHPERYLLQNEDQLDIVKNAFQRSAAQKNVFNSPDF